MHRRRFSFRRERPPWWPENEPWPPTGPWHMRRNPFLRRLGCFFGLMFFFSLTLFFTVLMLGADALGLVQIPHPLPAWAAPLMAFLFLFGASAIFSTVAALRRAFTPLDQLLEASGRVATGDYSTRVIERGPPEVRSLARAFNSMAERLQVSDTQRRNLLADVTHELRSPLTVIQGHVEGMIDGVYTADQARLNFILEETHLLSRLVEDLRTLSLAESGALQLKAEPTDLGLLVRETAAAFESQADMSGVRLQAALPEEIPVIRLDPARIREVLANLIVNAVRYTPRGGSVRLRVDNGGTGAGVRVSVSDDGPGIPPEDLRHVFERFYKSSDSGGMGLGLSIAKYLVEAHGGGIEAESSSGSGTTISFTLPA
jgi:two-component system sensor histidine kinase BaeS